MSLIQVKNLTFSYFGYTKNIFDNVDFCLDTNWKTGLIGRNGIGKSTFFKLLLDKLDYRGNIIKNVEIKNFPLTVDDEDIFGIDLFNLHSEGQEEWKLFKELNLLKTEYDILYRPFSSLSKGEQTKLLLAILFTFEGYFLLIDEPTNHLDLHGRELIKNYLNGKKSFLLISHDRDLLDSCTDHIISINKNSIEIEAGNFSSWYENKKKKNLFELTENEKLSKDIKRLKKASRQSESWSNKVEKRKNKITKSGDKPDKGYIGHQAAKMMKKSKTLSKRLNKSIALKKGLLKDVERKDDLKLHLIPPKKNLLINIKDVSAFYGDRQAIKGLNLRINDGDRIAILGKNGSGKSTLLKLILGEKIQYQGSINMLSDLKISYVPQDSAHLDGNLKDFVISQNIDESLFKTILNKLGFSKELFDINLENYSEGQKKKVLLAGSLSKDAHIFIWDEPLNYIDLISRIQIEELILKYNPTLVFVEHDKRFVDVVSTKILEL